MTHICVSTLCYHWFIRCLCACLVPSHYVNRRRSILNSALGNIFQGKLKNKNKHTFIHLNWLKPRQNDRHFPYDIINCNFLNENVLTSIKILLKFVPPLVHIMAWRRLGDKMLSEPIIVRLLTQTCVTRPQRINAFEKVVCKMATILSRPQCVKYPDVKTIQTN